MKVITKTSFVHPQSIKYQINNKTNKQKGMSNAAVLHEANEFVKQGNYEKFLAYCTEDTTWVFVGEQILNGKDEVRKYMNAFYLEPPVFTVDTTVEDGNFVIVTGQITLKDKAGNYNHYDYCDLWQFSNGKMAGVKAYVIEKKS